MSEPEVLWEGEIDGARLRVLAEGAAPEGPIVLRVGEPYSEALDGDGDHADLWLVAGTIARQLRFAKGEAGQLAHLVDEQNEALEYERRQLSDLQRAAREYRETARRLVELTACAPAIAPGEASTVMRREINRADDEWEAADAALAALLPPAEPSEVAK